MPSLSPTMTEGTIVKWLKKEGDPIEPGDVLCEIQTDKAVVGLETEEEGVLQKIVIPENTQNVQLGEIIAIILGEGESSDASPVVSSKIVMQQELPRTASLTDLMGPSVKRLLDEFNIKIKDVAHSGPKNNLLKGDVLEFIKNHNLQPVKIDVLPKHKKIVDSSLPSSKGAYIDIPVSSTDLENAHQFIQSKLTMPHGYMSTDCKVDNTLNYIENYFKKCGVEVSLNEFIIKSVIFAIKRVPKINTMRHNGHFRLPDSINILITDFNNGQYNTSLIKDAGNLTVQSIYENVRESKPESLESVFKISNLGSLGISNFIEVIAPDDVATLTVSSIQSVFEEDTPVKKMKVTLSFDSCVVGETEAGEFLEVFKNSLENPLSLMC